MGELFLLNLGIVSAAMLLLWVVSVASKNASIVDIFWGFGYVIVAWVGFWFTDGSGLRKVLLLVLTTIWGLRLTGYLAWRNLGKGEDYRYRAMRNRIGSRFWLVSLFTVFGLQALLIGIVSLPVQAGQLAANLTELTIIQVLGIAFWGIGFYFETVGDAQLARFKADPQNRGKVMDQGLWRYTRHPNYFGDFMIWWGLYLVAVATPSGFLDVGWTAIGPLIMSLLLMRVSGVTLLESSLRKRRPGYEEYIRRTSAFFPRPPRNG